jgi:hypothetical protein
MANPHLEKQSLIKGKKSGSVNYFKLVEGCTRCGFRNVDIPELKWKMNAAI